MNNGGDAAEQIVRLSLEGFEVAAKLTGSMAKELTVLLVSVLKQEQKTKGKARLTNMLKSGKELKVFSIPNKDLKKFVEQAKKYGVLYCVLKDKYNKANNATADIIARAEDASKIQRIFDRFDLGKVEVSSIENPTVAKTDKDPLSRQDSNKADMRTDKGISKHSNDKPSVREKLEKYKSNANKDKKAERIEPTKPKSKSMSNNRQTIHKNIRKKKRRKER